jgi:hypothetical protein
VGNLFTFHLAKRRFTVGNEDVGYRLSRTLFNERITIDERHTQTLCHPTTNRGLAGPWSANEYRPGCHQRMAKLSR